MPRPCSVASSGLCPASVSIWRAHATAGSDFWAASRMSLLPPLTIHQPVDAEPSPPTLALLSWVAPAHVLGCQRYLTSSCMPFCADSTTVCVQNDPATMAMNTSGSLAARVVMASVIVGACGSTVSLEYWILALLGEESRYARNPAS